MTKAHSEPDDNGGRCEWCDTSQSAYVSQSTVPVMLGGGLGLGTMWVCTATCRKVVLAIRLLRELLSRVQARRRA